MNDAIARHCRELDRCNQRGGRMLSVFDLLAVKTLDLDLAVCPTHVLVFDAGNNKKIEPKVNNYMAEPDYVGACRDFLKKISQKTRTIEQTRQKVVDFLAHNHSM